MMAIIAGSDAANLVLQASNSRDAMFICCCCGILRGLKQHPRPADVVSTAFIAIMDNTWRMIARGQMQGQ